MDFQKMINDAKAKADANGDGKIDLEDVKSVFSNLGDIAGSLKDKMFGGK